MNMKNKRKMQKLASTILIIMLLLSASVVSAEDNTVTTNAAITNTATTNTDYLQSIMDMIKQNYKGNITDKQLVEGSIKGMFNTMDPYTTFYTPTEAESFMGNINGSYTGIGISMEKSGEYILVLKVFEGSPAEE